MGCRLFGIRFFSISDYALGRQSMERCHRRTCASAEHRFEREPRACFCKRLSADDVWAVGWTKYFTMSQTLIEHWDGVKWKVVPSPNTKLGSNILSGVIAA